MLDLEELQYVLSGSLAEREMVLTKAFAVRQQSFTLVYNHSVNQPMNRPALTN